MSNTIAPNQNSLPGIFPGSPIVDNSENSIIRLGPKNKPFCFIYPKDVPLSYTLPKEIEYSGRLFLRFYDRVYIPEKPSIVETSIIFDHLSSNYENDCISDIKFNILVYRHLLELSYISHPLFIVKEAKRKILDLGCGTGISALAYAKYIQNNSIDVFGLDVSREMVNICRNRSIEALHILSSKLPFRDNSFDLIVGAFVSHFIWDTDSFIEILRILNPNCMISMNLYKPGNNWKKKYRKDLKAIGFSEVHFHKKEIKTKRIKRIIDFLTAIK